MSHKKSLFALAALALATAGASAQTTVSLYGIIDAAMRSESTVTRGTSGASQKQLAPGGMSQSRLGVNLGEDLGDGWRAVGNFEHRFMSDTGAQSSASDFWRQAWVGLVTPVGRVTIGRQYNVLFDLTTSTFAAYKYSPYIEQFKPELGVSIGNRQSNMVKYTLAQGDFVMEAQVSAGEGVGDKTMGGMARYQLGSFALGAGLLNSKDPAGKQVKGRVLGASYSAGPLYFNLAKGWNSFDAGFNTTLIVGYSTALVSPATPANLILTEAAFDVKDRDLLSTGFTYQLTPQFNIGAQYYKLNQNHHNAVFAGRKSAAGMYSLVGDYALSKRTDVYVEYDRISINSSSPTTFAAGCTAAAFNGTNAASSTLLNTSGCKRSRTGYMVGMRHRF